MRKTVTFYDYITGYLAECIPKDKLELIISEWDMDKKVKITISQIDEKSEKSMNLFYAINDCMAKDQAVNKEYMKKSLKIAFGVSEYSMGYMDLKSLSKYTQKEMNNLIQGCITECFEQGIDISHLLPEWRELNDN